MKHPSDGFPLLLGREGPGGHHLPLDFLLEDVAAVGLNAWGGVAGAAGGLVEGGSG